MALPIRTKTNRANAQKSTGPKTDYGKSIAAQNSLKHGILSQRIIVGSESQDLFNAFSQDILEDFAQEARWNARSSSASSTPCGSKGA